MLETARRKPASKDCKPADQTETSIYALHCTQNQRAHASLQQANKIAASWIWGGVAHVTQRRNTPQGNLVPCICSSMQF
jgi:hypothetical protein